jgi:pyrimidine deaminase RibD-like protein
MATYRRVKYAESDNNTVVKGEGKDMLTRKTYALGTIITRSEDKSLEEAST